MTGRERAALQHGMRSEMTNCCHVTDGYMLSRTNGCIKPARCNHFCNRKAVCICGLHSEDNRGLYCIRGLHSEDNRGLYCIRGVQFSATRGCFASGGCNLRTRTIKLITPIFQEQNEGFAPEGFQRASGKPFGGAMGQSPISSNAASIGCIASIGCSLRTTEGCIASMGCIQRTTGGCFASIGCNSAQPRVVLHPGVAIREQPWVVLHPWVAMRTQPRVALHPGVAL